MTCTGPATITAPSSSTWPGSTWTRSTAGSISRAAVHPQAGLLPGAAAGQLGQAHRVQRLAGAAADQDHPGGPAAGGGCWPTCRSAGTGPPRCRPGSTGRTGGSSTLTSGSRAWAGAGNKLIVSGVRVRAVDRHHQAAAHLQDRGPAAAERRAAAADRGPGQVVPGSRTPPAWSRQERYSYDWAGFRCEHQLPLVPVRGPVADRRLGLPSSWSGRGGCGGPRGCTPRLTARPSGRSSWRWHPDAGSAADGSGASLHVGVAATPAVLAGCELAGGELAIDVDANGCPAWRTGRAWCWPGPRARPPAAYAGPPWPPATAAVTRLRAHRAAQCADASSRRTAKTTTTCRSPSDGDATEWDLYLAARARPGSGSRSRPSWPSTSYPAVATEEVGVERTRNGNAAIVQRRAAPADHRGAAGSSDGQLTLRGSFPAPVASSSRRCCAAARRRDAARAPARPGTATASRGHRREPDAGVRAGSCRCATARGTSSCGRPGTGDGG